MKPKFCQGGHRSHWVTNWFNCYSILNFQAFFFVKVTIILPGCHLCLLGVLHLVVHLSIIMRFHPFWSGHRLLLIICQEDIHVTFFGFNYHVELWHWFKVFFNSSTHVSNSLGAYFQFSKLMLAPYFFTRALLLHLSQVNVGSTFMLGGLYIKMGSKIDIALE